MIGRLQHLERSGLASPAGPAQWTLRPDAEPVLRDLGMRGDIIKTMHQALAGRGWERPLGDYVIETGGADSSIVGRLIDRGLHDELSGETYAVIDGVDGRVHHVRFRGIEALELASPLATFRRKIVLVGIAENRAGCGKLQGRTDLELTWRLRNSFL